MYRENHETKGWLEILMLFVMATVITSLVLAYRKLRGEQRSLYVLILIMAIVPLLLLLVLSLPPLRPSFVDRYLLPSVPFWFAAIGIAFATLLKEQKPRIAVPVAVALFATLTLGVAQVYSIGNYNKNANIPCQFLDASLCKQGKEENLDNLLVIAVYAATKEYFEGS